MAGAVDQQVKKVEITRTSTTFPFSNIFVISLLPATDCLINIISSFRVSGAFLARSIHEFSAAAADIRENTASAPSRCPPYCSYDCALSCPLHTVFSRISSPSRQTFMNIPG